MAEDEEGEVVVDCTRWLADELPHPDRAVRFVRKSYRQLERRLSGKRLERTPRFRCRANRNRSRFFCTLYAFRYVGIRDRERLEDFLREHTLQESEPKHYMFASVVELLLTDPNFLYLCP